MRIYFPISCTVVLIDILWFITVHLNSRVQAQLLMGLFIAVLNCLSRKSPCVTKCGSVLVRAWVFSHVTFVRLNRFLQSFPLGPVSFHTEKNVKMNIWGCSLHLLVPYVWGLQECAWYCSWIRSRSNTSSPSTNHWFAAVEWSWDVGLYTEVRLLCSHLLKHMAPRWKTVRFNQTKKNAASKTPGPWNWKR